MPSRILQTGVQPITQLCCWGLILHSQPVHACMLEWLKCCLTDSCCCSMPQHDWASHTRPVCLKARGMWIEPRTHSRCSWMCYQHELVPSKADSSCGWDICVGTFSTALTAAMYCTLSSGSGMLDTAGFPPDMQGKQCLRAA